MLRSTKSNKREVKALAAVYSDANRHYVPMASAELRDDIETASTVDDASRVQRTKEVMPTIGQKGRRSLRRAMAPNVRYAAYAILFNVIVFATFYLTYWIRYCIGHSVGLTSKIEREANAKIIGIEEANEKSIGNVNLQTKTKQMGGNNNYGIQKNVFNEILSKLESKAETENIEKYNNNKRRRHHGLDPANWESFTHSELQRYFGCNHRSRQNHPVISRRNWQYFRDLYNQFESAQEPNDVDTSYKLGNESYVYPIESVMTPQKGRGLVASRNIKEGERIFRASNNTIVFRTGHAWRKLLWHLYHAPPPPDEDGYTDDGFACDILAWSWNQRWPSPDGPIQIVVDIDESSLLNRPSHGEEANIRCGIDEEAECGMDYYSTMDIKKGYEILCDYSDFSTPKWHRLGL